MQKTKWKTPSPNVEELIESIYEYAFFFFFPGESSQHTGVNLFKGTNWSLTHLLAMDY